MTRTIKPMALICAVLVAGIASGGIATTIQGSDTNPGARTTLLVPLPSGPVWQDMAFLAAVPAATVVNNGAPSLIALDASGALSPEIQDYLRRYRPDDVYLLGGSASNLVVAGHACNRIEAGSAEEAARKLSKSFWQQCRTAVICPEEDYEAALVASSLAARLRVPLFFATAQKVSDSTVQEIRRLKARDILVVGCCGDGARSLRRIAHLTELAGARDVMAWTKKQNISVRYLAALNPMDRDRTIVRKLSLVGALLAAGRDGLVAPLSYEVQWKAPFSGAEIPGDLPADLPKSEVVPKLGRVVINGLEVQFLLTGKSQEHDLRVYFDRGGTGTYTGIGEGPFATGDTVELGGKRYVITLGTKNGDCSADVRLTWPSAEQVVGDLRGYYKALGAAPEHLCLVGLPDAVPQAIFGWGGGVTELTSDLPYSHAGNNPFAEIGVGRVIAENASFATLYASRVLTYTSLLDPEWQDRACQSRWENTSEKILESVGFDASFRHTEANMKLLVPPTDSKKGKWAKTFEQDSPLARSAVVTHMDHSWWRELGHMFGWDADVLMAPVLVESGGCLTTTLDREPDFRSVIARLFRKGAVAFHGNSRQGCAPQELQRMEFWNGILLHGETIGQAHRRSINSALVTIFDKKQETSGDYGYQLRIRTLLGDPAFKLRVPCPPRSAPARITVDGDTVTVHPPAQWWPVKICVPEDWKQWKGKDLFVLRGTGTYALRNWCSEEYDREETYMTAEFTTRRRVARIEQVQKPPSPLGWTGSYYADEHADGSRTYRWAVRMADFDQLKGQVVNAVERLDYRMVYE